MATDYRGPLVVNKKENAQSKTDSCCNIVGNETVEGDVEGGAPDPYSQEEKVAKKLQVDVSMPVAIRLPN